MSTTYYVRARGHVSGPFDTDSLQRMVRRGLLSRIHEVSADKQQWIRAADLPDVFVSPRPQHEASVSLEDQEASVALDDGVLPPSHAAGMNYYYTQAGSTIGPVSMPVLNALAHNGTLSPDDMVWREGAEIATPASQLAQLAGVFGTGRSAASTAAGSNKSARLPAFIRLREQARDSALIFGFVIGGAILLLVNLPMLQIGDATLFWWHIASAGEAVGFTLSCVYVLLVAVTLCIIAALLHGRARSLVYISLAGLGLMMWAILPLFSGGPADGTLALSALMLIPPLAVISLSIARFRSVADDYQPARVLLTVVGSVLVLVSFIGGIVLLLNMTGEGDVIPGWVTAASVIMAISCLVGLAAGILGIINVKPIFSGELNLTIIILSLATLILSVIYATILMIGISDMAGLGREVVREFGGSGDGVPSSAAIGFLLFRLVFVFYAFVALLGSGVMELLATIADQPARPVQRSRPV